MDGRDKPGHDERVLARFACVELGAFAVTTNTRSAPAEMEYFAGRCGAVAAFPAEQSTGSKGHRAEGLKQMRVELAVHLFHDREGLGVRKR